MLRKGHVFHSNAAATHIHVRLLGDIQQSLTSAVHSLHRTTFAYRLLQQSYVFSTYSPGTRGHEHRLRLQSQRLHAFGIWTSYTSHTSYIPCKLDHDLAFQQDTIAATPRSCSHWVQNRSSYFFFPPPHNEIPPLPPPPSFFACFLAASSALFVNLSCSFFILSRSFSASLACLSFPASTS